MKRKFSTSWKASKRPNKQRKYKANTPIHLKRKLVSVNLVKELRKKYGMRNVPIRKGDTIKVMKGKFKNKTGKINAVDFKKLKVEIEGIQIKKQDNSKVNLWLNPFSLQIIELNLEDKRRNKKFSENKEKIAKGEKNNAP